mgnify:CR=1 FL=1
MLREEVVEGVLRGLRRWNTTFCTAREHRPKVKRALISVSDKQGLGAFARQLVESGFELVSTGGTLAALREEGLAAKSVSEFTAFPEILGGRVKTLHPAVFAGILARRHHASDLETLAEHGLHLFDLVVVNLYPFDATIEADPYAFDTCLEKIDVGGPSMLRAAAKSLRDVTAIVDPADYARVAEELAASGGTSLKTRQELAVKVFQHTSRYDAAIASYLAAHPAPAVVGEPVQPGDDLRQQRMLPAQLVLSLPRVAVLRYGENPHQMAALYGDDHPAEPSVATARQLQGKELSYNNLNDGEAALELVRELAMLAGPSGRAAVGIIKHANPCGAAFGGTVLEAWQAALRCDPVSTFGGIVASSQAIDGPAAEAMKELFLEAIICPAFTSEARDILKSKKQLRLLETGPLPAAMPSRRALKSIVGGYLVQELDRCPAPAEYEVVTKRRPEPGDLEALWFAWTVVKAVKSNAIVYASSHATLGIGAGQMSRVDSARFGARKAADQGLSLEGAFLASDAFFPFRDGVDVAAKAGVKAIIQPGGSKRDDESIQAADEHGLLMVFTGARHFRH